MSSEVSGPSVSTDSRTGAGGSLKERPRRRPVGYGLRSGGSRARLPDDRRPGERDLDQWLALATAAEAGGFDGLFTSDHYFSVEGPRPAGARSTPGRCSPRSRPEPGASGWGPWSRRPRSVYQPLLAKGRDHRRSRLGRANGARMGAGWWEEEHRTHGVPVPSDGRAHRPSRRAARDRPRTVDRGGFLVQGQFYAVRLPPSSPTGAATAPADHRRWEGRPRIASLAAAWGRRVQNTYHAMPDACRDRFARVHDAPMRSGRAAGSLRTSLMAGCVIADRERVPRPCRATDDLGCRGLSRPHGRPVLWTV